MSAQHNIENWREEKQSAYLYRVMAERESEPSRRKLFCALADAADEQAEIWVRALANDSAQRALAFEPSTRARLVARLVSMFGVMPLRSVLAAMKVRGLSVYTHTGAGHAMPATVEEVGRRHRGVDGGNLRAAVFGVNDGLVSNASLILGVAGAGVDQRAILLSGIAGLIAGACSMAAGEYVSVRSQREVYEYQIGLENEELAQYPKEEAAELALIYAARGMAETDARRFADQMIADPERALDTLAREELGLNPEALGSPWGAALASFFSFAAGALVPLLPFFLTSSRTAVLAAAALSALSLFAVGAVLSLFTGRSALASGARMLAIGASAGAVTYLIGYLLGVSVA